MSCNGCRVLRKGCSDNCILRPSIQWIDTPESQGHATLFVAKFFGRAGLVSFLSGVPENQRPALFQSLLFEACGRTVNPVNGAVGLMWTGNWNVCQAAVQTVLRGGTLRPIPDFMSGVAGTPPGLDDASEAEAAFKNIFHRDPNSNLRSAAAKRRRGCESPNEQLVEDLGLSLTPCSANFDGIKDRRPGTPSRNSEESVTTACFDSSGGHGGGGGGRGAAKLLDLFN